MATLDIGVFGARAIPSTYSGYETFLTTLLPALAARGHRVRMYCRQGETEGTGPYAGVERVVLPAVPGKQLNTLSHGAIASLRARLARHDVTLVVNVANAPYCALHRWTGRAVVLNTDGQEWLRSKWGRGARAYFRGCAHVAKGCATALVSDCAAMAAVYGDQFGAASTVIPYCVPAQPLAPAAAVCARLGVEPDRYFVIAARWNPENNVDTIAGAYSRTDLPLPLLVLGAANYRSPVASRLGALAARDPRIRVVGHVGARDEFLALLGAARAYVHGHSVGGTNPSLVEAMHAGAFVCALDTPFNRETLGPAGRYCTVADVGSVLADTCALDAPTRQQQQHARADAQARAAARFDAASVVEAYERLLVAAAGAPRRSVALATRWSAS